MQFVLVATVLALSQEQKSMNVFRAAVQAKFSRSKKPFLDHLPALRFVLNAVVKVIAPKNPAMFAVAKAGLNLMKQ